MSFVGGGLWFLWSPDAAASTVTATVTATATAAAAEIQFVGYAGLSMAEMGKWASRNREWLAQKGGGSSRTITWLGKKREWK